MPIKRDLEARLGRGIAIANDANCFALSEATDGAGQGAAVVFGVILGTGVGGGMVVNGRVLEGRNGVGGEWGHNPLPWPNDDERPGAACFCGQRGCIETWLSGPGLARDHHAHVPGDASPAHEIVARAAQHDAASDATLARYEDRLARSLAHVINIVDPDVIVLGGGLSNVDRWYKSVPRLWSRWVFSDRVDTELLRHAHGDSSGVRGAACCREGTWCRNRIRARETRRDRCRSARVSTARPALRSDLPGSTVMQKLATTFAWNFSEPFQVVQVRQRSWRGPDAGSLSPL